MNQELQQKLLEYLNSGESFVREQAPDFVKQAMAYYLWSAKFELCSSVVIFMGMILIAGMLLWFSSRRASEGAIVLATIICIAALIPFFSIFCSFNSLKKMQIAPKLYMIDELTKGKCK
jgi:hypothetical protein